MDAMLDHGRFVGRSFTKTSGSRRLWDPQVEAIVKLRRDERLVDTEEDEIVLWMMSVDGLELSMSFAVNLWKRRNGLRAQLKID